MIRRNQKSRVTKLAVQRSGQRSVRGLFAFPRASLFSILYSVLFSVLLAFQTGSSLHAEPPCSSGLANVGFYADGLPQSDSGQLEASEETEEETEKQTKQQKKQPSADEIDQLTPDNVDAAGKFKSFSTPVMEPPAWVTKGSHYDEVQQAEFKLVNSHELLQQLEAEHELEERLVEAVREKLDDMFGEDACEAIGIDIDYVRENLLEPCVECDSQGIYTQLRSWPVSEENLNKLDSAVRDAFQCYALLRFDEDFELWASEKWQNCLVVSRTMQTGLMLMSTLLGLGLLFLYCTAEHKTRGFYSRRLQTAGVGLLLLVAAIVWWLSTRFTWL